MDAFKSNYALVFKVLFFINVRIKIFFKSKINFPERFTFPYHLIKILFGTASKGIWNKRMDLKNRDLEHFARFRKIRHFVIENVICFANIPHLF